MCEEKKEEKKKKWEKPKATEEKIERNVLSCDKDPGGCGMEES